MKENLIGQQFGHLTVIDYNENNKKWICKCDCGNMTEVVTSNLKLGNTKSCGHLKNAKGVRKHKDINIMNDKKDYQEYIKELGQKIKTYRIMKEMSQQDLEDKTGVSKRSISRLEQGESVQVDNLFKILLALELGDNIELLVPDQTKRPSFYLEKTADKPKRVRKKIEKSEFKWGDEQ